MTNYDYLLPIGTVVKLEGVKRPYMITGILQKHVRKDMLYDYVGVVYPEGQISEAFNLLFMHEKITEVVFKGYEDPDGNRTSFLALLDLAMNTPATAVAEFPESKEII